MAKKPRFIEFFCLFKHIYHGVWDFHLFSQFSPRWKCLEKETSEKHHIPIVQFKHFFAIRTENQFIVVP